jgi:hypothetical protein
VSKVNAVCRGWVCGDGPPERPAELEAFAAMRRQAEQMEVARHAVVRPSSGKQQLCQKPVKGHNAGSKLKVLHFGLETAFIRG